MLERAYLNGVLAVYTYIGYWLSAEPMDQESDNLCGEELH